MTRSDVARALDISPERVRQLTLAGQLRCEHTPLGRLYNPLDVERLASERAAQKRDRNPPTRT